MKQYFIPPAGAIGSDHMYSQITASGPLHSWVSLLVLLLGPVERQNLVQQQASHNPVQDQPANVLQALQASPELEAEVAAAAEVAFGEPVTLNRVAGPQLRLHVGRPTRELSITDRAYAEELAQLPSADAQGDGYRGYLGSVLSLLGPSPRILLIDEPEAFLHPPQARRIGSYLADRASRGSQLVCATHSSDVIAGALSTNKPIHVVRIARDGEVNIPTHLHNEDLAPLWADPLVRYSGALEALFSRGLVICENERDCTFYLATLDADPTAPKNHDLTFVSVGGKSSIPRVAHALRRAGTPVFAICDIDVLNDEALLARIVDALGGNLTESLRTALRVVTSGVASETGTTAPELQAQLVSRLQTETGRVDRALRNDLSKLIRPRTGWARLKQSGLSVLRGDQREAADKVLAELGAMGLLIAPVGELEGWVPQAGGKGAGWLPKAFDKGGHLGDQVRDFVRQLTSPQAS